MKTGAELSLLLHHRLEEALGEVVAVLMVIRIEVRARDRIAVKVHHCKPISGKKTGRQVTRNEEEPSPHIK